MTARSFSQKDSLYRNKQACGFDCYYHNVLKWTTMAPRERLPLNFCS